MSNIVNIRNLAETIDLKAMSRSLVFTAGGASDAATFTGLSIDREAFGAGSLSQSMDVAVPYDVTLGSGATLSITFDLQDSADGVTWADFRTEAATVFATGPSGGGAVQGVARMALGGSNVPPGDPGVNLGGARRFIRTLIVPDFSRAGTDTGLLSVVGVFGGFDRLPAPQI